MKLVPCKHSLGSSLGSRYDTCGLTLVEMMVAVAVFSLVGMALVYSHICGLRFDQLVCSKLGACDRSRIGFDKLTTDIRASKIWSIRNGGSSGFTPCGNATNQIGIALQISFTTDTNTYVRYYFDTNAAKLYRLESSSGVPSMLCDSLTNTTGQSMSFRAEDYRGSNTSDLTFKYVIVTTREFCQYQYPLTKVGPNYYYN